ncbi:DUF2177 family protein [Candidatus Dependentiae bacterium]|nr:MAG: DUF2177 family protein [Candidatus Dependentiae bacterium]
MNKFFYYIVSLFCFMIMDGIWLGLLMKNMYQTMLGSMLRPFQAFQPVHGIATLLVWICIVSGIWIFVTPLTAYKTYTQTFFYGALFGLLLYGVYEGTNFVVLNQWPLSIVILDIAWGMFACGTLSLIIKKLHS